MEKIIGRKRFWQRFHARHLRRLRPETKVSSLAERGLNSKLEVFFVGL